MSYVKCHTLNIPDEFLKEEIRCEYLITEKQKKIWAVEMDLLAKLDEVCSNNDIVYSVYAGTMLGVVRHGGFIPWDDDLDVAMTRENYEKLLKVADTAFEEPYFLQTGYNQPEFFLHYARLRNSETTGLITNNISAEYHNGIYIDIYVMDGIPEKDSQVYFQLLFQKFWSRQLFDYTYHDDTGIVFGKARRIEAKVLQKTLFKVVPYHFLLDQYHKSCQMYNHKTKRVANRSLDIATARKYAFSCEGLNNVKRIDFEGLLSVPIAYNYEEILTHVYGDYMKFPPVEKRGLWHDGTLIFEPDIPYQEYYQQHYGAKEQC